MPPTHAAPGEQVYYVVGADAVVLYNCQKDAHAWNREVLEVPPAAMLGWAGLGWAGCG